MAVVESHSDKQAVISKMPKQNRPITASCDWNDLGASGLSPTHKSAVWLIVRLFAANVRLAPKRRKSNVMSINPFYAAYRADPARIAVARCIINTNHGGVSPHPTHYSGVG
jgi:hypothetical protein